MFAGIHDDIQNIMHISMMTVFRKGCYTKDHARTQYSAIKHDRMRCPDRHGNDLSFFYHHKTVFRPETVLKIEINITAVLFWKACFPHLSDFRNLLSDCLYDHSSHFLSCLLSVSAHGHADVCICVGYRISL